ncbi:N-6 DNA methylase [Candidatus Bipolaricaulota bacterium]|nr:N-6 DNA methylase [Candidatus Bipolaricaulota bacterium]
MTPNAGGHPADVLPPGVNNQGLFSDYYLTELVREDEFFRASAKDAEAVWRAIRSIYDKVKAQLPASNEAQVEQLFIRPVLDALGYKDSYAVQPDVPSPEGRRSPDYAFFANPDDLAAAEATAKGRTEYFAKALAVADAKAWDRSLDRRDKGGRESFDKTAPSYQIDYYLRATDRRWGLLTNGRRWRLYHRDSSYRMDVFYEVELVALLETYSEDFLYFFAFFRKEALATGFLDRVLSGSRDYVAKVGKELKDNVYEALRLLAEGFLKCPGNGLTGDDLEAIRENTFVLIYRFLFLFYAEDRRLLPLDKADYRDSYSLRGMANEIARRLDERRTFSPAADVLWSRLGVLFRIVNEGDPYLSVPPYNGGLFDPGKHPLLARWKLGDHYLAQAVDCLARAEAAGRMGRGPMSYRDLDIRDLGSIYEGLLEHHLRVATVDTAVVKEKDREVFVPKEELGDRRPLRIYYAGEVYLQTDKGERKTSGSYYTPDYIVKYIVNHTLGPLVEEKKHNIAEERKRLEEEYKKARGQNREFYQKKLSELDGRLIDEILSIKVLDPAMGSGHFLVGATDFLARALIEALGSAPGESDEEDVRWARREVVERCIYGVDLNPLAVELAKLSLWIYTTAKDRPLSFLDHHLRVGNSLIGAWIKDLGQLPRPDRKGKARSVDAHTIGLFEGKLRQKLPTVLSDVMELLRKPSDRVEDIREKEAIHGRILGLLRPFKEVAGVWTSTCFGVEVNEGNYEAMLLKLADPPAKWEEEVRSQEWFQRAQDEAACRHFFHWELEFPEVFFDQFGRRQGESAGFSVVLGNPPYLNVKRGALRDDSPYLTSAFRLAEGQWDAFALFFEQSYRLLRFGGQWSFIIPRPALSSESYEGLRACWLDSRELVQLGDAGMPFGGVGVESVIPLVRKGISAAWIALHSVRPEGTIPLGWLDHDLSRSMPFKTIPLRAASTESSILAATARNTRRLGELLALTRGIEAGKNAPFVRRTPSESSVPLGFGDDLQRYDYSPRHWVAWDEGDVNTFKPAALYEQDEKLLIRRVGVDLQASVDTSRSRVLNTIYVTEKVAQCNLLFLCALINSRLLNSWFRIAFVFEDRLFPYARVSQLTQLPIRRISFVTPNSEQARLAEKGHAIYRQDLLTYRTRQSSADLFSTTLRFVEERLQRSHPTDPDLVRRHNGDPLNKDWQIPVGAPWEQSDVVHDFLAFLAEEMIRLNKEKQAEMRNFLAWLEAELQVQPDKNGNTGIEALTGKAKLKNYLGDYQKGEPELPFTEFWGILQKNKNRIRRPLSHEFMAQLRAAYERSLSKLRPIKERLRLTDGLIDQIVYRLYGLTEDDIKTVDERRQPRPEDDGSTASS